jgi:hypothetical protein
LFLLPVKFDHQFEIQLIVVGMCWEKKMILENQHFVHPKIQQEKNGQVVKSDCVRFHGN